MPYSVMYSFAVWRHAVTKGVVDMAEHKEPMAVYVQRRQVMDIPENDVGEVPG